MGVKGRLRSTYKLALVQVFYTWYAPCDEVATATISQNLASFMQILGG